jgi:hypothetical protein
VGCTLKLKSAVGQLLAEIVSEGPETEQLSGMFNEQRVQVVESLKVNFFYFCRKEFSYSDLQSINQPAFRYRSNRECVATYSWVTVYGTYKSSTYVSTTGTLLCKRGEYKIPF